ncbi:MAG: septum formation initiator family protein [Alphaproteobacteria bacterium]|nr:septum formation initiator family protein [Alphaproteobacteria bacterium]
MALVSELKRRARHVVGPLVGSLLVAYFAFHAIEGDRGIKTWQRLDQEVVAATGTRAALVARRTAMEARVAMLHPDSLDRDLLEERARLLLGYVPANAVVMGEPIIPTTRLAGFAPVR